MREGWALHLGQVNESLARCAALLRNGVSEEQVAGGPLRWTLASSTRTNT